MDAATVFERWAPAGATWSDWVKPVLFSWLSGETGDGRSPPRPQLALTSLVRVDETVIRHPYREARPNDIAVIVDLPGVQSVGAGLALAALGFQPVPLFTGLPGPVAAAPLVRVAVEVWPTLDALVAGAIELAAYPAAAPPAFLLDARRLGRLWRRRPGDFDNRSMSNWTDFPTAERLSAAGVRSVVIWPEAQVSWDLVETLRRWQDAGMGLFRTSGTGPPCAFRAGTAWWPRLRDWHFRRSLGGGHVAPMSG
jgi:hypothetical protein